MWEARRHERLQAKVARRHARVVKRKDGQNKRQQAHRRKLKDVAAAAAALERQLHRADTDRRCVEDLIAVVRIVIAEPSLPDSIYSEWEHAATHSAATLAAGVDGAVYDTGLKVWGHEQGAEELSSPALANVSEVSLKFGEARHLVCMFLHRAHP